MSGRPVALVACPACRGAGERLLAGHHVRCALCGGTGHVSESVRRHLKVGSHGFVAIERLRAQDEWAARLGR